MSAVRARPLLSAAVAIVILAGVFTPLVAVGLAGPSTQSQGQLNDVINATLSSRAYAQQVVGMASAHGLAVSSAQSKLSQGDALLATAQADAQSGASAAAVESAQAAMSDYTAASASASLALSGAGLTTSVDYSAAAGAAAEVNATVSVIAAAAAHACAQTDVSTSGSSGLAEACAQVNAQVQAADAHLSQAASLLARANGEANATVSLSQVLTQVAQARSEVNATQSYLVTIASYSYAQRADAYVSAYIRSLSSEANATIQAEQSAYANLTSFQAQYAAYARLQGSAAANVASSASILAAAISKVDGYSGNVSSSISAAQSTESQLHADLQALPGLSVIAAQPGIVADIQACMSDGASYNASLSALQAELNGFSKVQLPSYGSYLGAVNSDGSSARSNGSAYVSSYDKVVSDLQPFLSLPQVQAVLGLSVSATVGAAASSMSQQAAQMTSGGTDASRFSSSVTTAQSDVPVSGALLSMAASAAAQSSVYLNATAAAATAQVSASVQAVAKAAAAFDGAAYQSTQATLGAYPSDERGLSGAGASLSSTTGASAGATATAVAYVGGSIQARIAGAASGRAEVSQALRFFSSQDITAGISAMVQASLEFQTASAVSV